MITRTQQKDAEGMVLAASGHDAAGMRMRLVGLSGPRTGRTPLFAFFIFGLALSAALPYGLGVAVLVWGIALIGAIIGTGLASVVLLKELFARTAAFGYAPTTAHITGKKWSRNKKAFERGKDGR